MLPTRGKFLMLAAGLLLSLPALGQFSGLAPDPFTYEGEKGQLAQPPRFPRSPAAWRDLPFFIDFYLKDHFGFRPLMILAMSELRYALRSVNAKAYANLDGRLFLRSDHMLEQSAGVIRRDAQVIETAGFLARLQGVLAKRGVRFLVASPPNASTIYRDQLPQWARTHGRATEYDLLLEQLAANGVVGIDLRPLLLAARASGETYFRYDTHWTPRGALVSFDAVAEAAGHREWQLDPPAILRRTGSRVGDLAAIIGMPGRLKEPIETADLPAGAKTPLSPPAKALVPGFAPFLVESNIAGPTIMIIGDSFTFGQEFLFADFLLQHAHRVIWQPHNFCNFDWGLVEQFQPAEIWWMPTERFQNCAPEPNRVRLPVE